MPSSAIPQNVIQLDHFRAKHATDLRSESRTTTGERMFTQVVESTDPNCVGVTLICTGIDTSAHGMRVTTDRAVPAGCAVDIWVEIDPKRRKLFLSGHVRWSRPLADGDEYELGIVLHSGHATDITTWRKLKYV